MSDYQKFLPEDIPDSQLPFWDSLREHAVRVQRCDDCGTYRYIPKDLCPRCHSERADLDARSAATARSTPTPWSGALRRLPIRPMPRTCWPT